MPEEAQHGGRRRRWLFALTLLALFGLAAAWALHHYSRPQRLTALLVAQTHSLLGLDLTLDGEAGFGWWPKLHLLLPQPTLQAPGAAAALLRADALEAVLPWRTLWSDRLQIERIDLRRPRLDADALAAWLAARPASKAAPPDVRMALHIDDASVFSRGKPVAQGVQIAFANSADLAAWLARLGAGALPLLPPLAGHAEAASLQIGGTRLDGVQVEIRDDAPATPAHP